LKAHHTAIPHTDVPDPDVVTHNDEDVGFFLLRLCSGETDGGEREHQGDSIQNAPPAT
jgi:hypothetical protein